MRAEKNFRFRFAEDVCSLQVATVECCDIIVIFAVIQFSWYNADAFKSDKNVINLQRNCWNQFVGTFSLR